MSKKKVIITLLLLAVLIGGFIYYLRWSGYGCTSCTTAPNVITDMKLDIEVVAENLAVPWSIAFASPTRMLVTERTGNIRVIEKGKLLSNPLKTFSEVSTGGESGLLGLVVDPNYSENKFVYASLTYSKNNRTYLKVVRLIDEGTRIVDDKILLDETPAARVHDGSRLKFGPDKKLYITTGDATEGKLAQDINSLAGKILRLNTDGSIPSDNPFPNSPIYSYGHRNPQGIDWDQKTGNLWESEHGPSTFDGPPGGDEINLIEAGENYGWPVVSHLESADGMIDPKLVFTPAVAPASLLVYFGNKSPALTGKILFGGLKGEGVYAVTLDAARTKAVSYEKLPFEVGRVRDIVEGPDGFIYFSTSNTDGRGSPQPSDDKIYRIVSVPLE